MKILRILDKIVDLLSKLALLFGGILLLAMAVNVTYGVVARYVFNSPSVVAIELTKILMIPALVLAVSYVQRYDRHLQVDFLSSRFPHKARLLLLQVIVPIMALFVVYVLVWKGWQSATYSRSINETSYSSWAEPLWPVRMTIPVGYALLFAVLVTQVIKGIASLFAKEKEAIATGEAPTEAGVALAQSYEATIESERV